MSASKRPYGKPVKLLIDFEGYPDGRLVLFEIWKKKGGKEEKITEVYGVIRRGKGIGEWIPQFEERKGMESLKRETLGKVEEEEKYHFIAKVDDKEAKSADLVFAYPLDIYLVDEQGKPLDGVEFTITFSDGTKKKGVFKKGHAKFDEAPSGKFELELDEYELVF